MTIESERKFIILDNSFKVYRKFDLNNYDKIVYFNEDAFPDMVTRAKFNQTTNLCVVQMKSTDIVMSRKEHPEGFYYKDDEVVKHLQKYPCIFKSRTRLVLNEDLDKKFEITIDAFPVNYGIKAIVEIEAKSPFFVEELKALNLKELGLNWLDVTGKENYYSYDIWKRFKHDFNKSI
jgi:hypothetical protein